MGLRTMLRLKPSLPPECARWFEGKEFTSDWLSTKLASWVQTLSALRGTARAVLDIGSYEGRSAIAFLELFPQASVTSIDLFDSTEVEARFDRNLTPYGERIVKIKSRAVPALDRLRSERQSFDAIYLDAGKRRDETLAQSTLAWPLLRTGGILIWDDLVWKPHLPDDRRPGPGIELFAKMFAGCLEELHRDKQLIVRKTSDWPGA